MSKSFAGPTTDGPQKITPEFAQRENRFGEPWIEVSPMFMFTFHPARYTVIDGKVVPQLGEQVLVDGVNQVQVSKKGRVNFVRARSHVEQDGWKFLPFEWGPGGESYLQAIQTRPGGSKGDPQTAYVSVFSSAYAGDPKVYPDERAYAEWLLELMADGRIPQPRPHKVRAMLEESKRKLGVALAKKMATRAEALQLEVTALEAWLKDHGQPKSGKAGGRKAVPTITED